MRSKVQKRKKKAAKNSGIKHPQIKRHNFRKILPQIHSIEDELLRRDRGISSSSDSD